MKRLIFIGSSSEGLEKAKEIVAQLQGLDNVQPLLWNDVFDPGSLTLETLENEVLRKCCGAVFVATPETVGAAFSSFYSQSIILPAGTPWKLPAGAFGENAGPG